MDVRRYSGWASKQNEFEICSVLRIPDHAEKGTSCNLTSLYKIILGKPRILCVSSPMKHNISDNTRIDSFIPTKSTSVQPSRESIFLNSTKSYWGLRSPISMGGMQRNQKPTLLCGSIVQALIVYFVHFLVAPLIGSLHFNPGTRNKMNFCIICISVECECVVWCATFSLIINRIIFQRDKYLSTMISLSDYHHHSFPS